MEMMTGATRSHRRTMLIAAALVLVDGILLGQGFISMFFGAGLILLWVPCLLIWSLIRKDRAGLTFRLRNIGIYVIAIALVFGCVLVNNSVARSRADDLIVAVKAFYTKYHHYPENLDQLVPEFIDKVPRPKYIGYSNAFIYHGYSNDAALIYVSVPPFGRKRYKFSTDKWGFFD